MANEPRRSMAQLRKQAQTLNARTTGLWHIDYVGQGHHAQSYRSSMTPNQSAKDMHQDARNIVASSYNFILTTLHYEPPRLASFLTGRTWKSNTLPLRKQTSDNHRRHSRPTRSTGASSTREHEPGATTTPGTASTTTGPSGASGATSHRCGTACSTRTATSGRASASSTGSFRFGTGTLTYRPGLR